MGWNYLSIPKLQRCNRWSLGMDKWFHPTLYHACDYLSMLGLGLNHVSKRGQWCLNNKTLHFFVQQLMQISINKYIKLHIILCVCNGFSSDSHGVWVKRHQSLTVIARILYALCVYMPRLTVFILTKINKTPYLLSLFPIRQIFLMIVQSFYYFVKKMP